MKTITVSENITLRPLSYDDAEAIFDTIDSQRDYLGKWLPFVAHTTSKEFISGFIDATLNAKNCEPTFTIRKGDEFVGLIGYKLTDNTNHKTEIGYWLSEPFQGQGIVTKSVKILCKYAFEALNINRVEVKCAVGNTPSSDIPKRLGFTLEGIERASEFVNDNHYFDVEVYSLLKSEF